MFLFSINNLSTKQNSVYHELHKSCKYVLFGFEEYLQISKVENSALIMHTVRVDFFKICKFFVVQHMHAFKNKCHPEHYFKFDITIAFDYYPSLSTWES